MMGLFSALLFPFTIEYLLLRAWVKYSLQLRIGFPGMTDYDFLPQLVIAAIVACNAIGRLKAIPLGLQPTLLKAHLGLMVFFIGFTFWLSSLSSIAPEMRWCWYALASAVFATALFLLVPPTVFLSAETRGVSLLFCLAVLSKPILILLAGPIWTPLTHLGGSLVFSAWTSLGSTMQIEYLDSAARILHPKHCLLIGRGCSGLDGVALMAFLVSIVTIRTTNRFNPMFLALWLSFGCFFMIALNAIRISLFLWGAIWIQGLWGNSFYTMRATEVLLHNGMTWLVYGTGLLLYLSLMSKAQFSFNWPKPLKTLRHWRLTEQES